MGSKRAKKVLLKDREIEAQKAKKISGGRKAGGQQQEFLVIKMSDVLISG